MSETSTSAGSVNPESPWLGLRSFSEETRGYFFGRDAELDDLYERVIHRPLTIFFGQSGLGKTSLLRAGLIPRLRETGFVPVILRVGWNAADEEPEQQVKAALRSALRSASVAPWQALAEFPDHLSLWHLLHDPTYGLLAAPEALPPPRLIFVFDQFEEIFTLGQKQRARADAWAETLAALVENRPPTALRAALQRDPSRLALLDLRAAPAKFLLSLRHDYLHLLERWRRQMPSLYDNRFELKMLTGPKAFQAVVFPGRLRAGAQPLVDEATAEAIVRFVAGAPLDKPLAAVDAVPPLLSLVCAELNRERVDNQAPAIVFDPLLGQPPEIRQFLLKVPLDADGKPEPVSRAAAERDLLAAGLSPEQIAQSLNSLWDSRLLTITGEATSQVIHLSANLAKVAARSGTDILQAFYNGCFAGLHGGVRPKLEELFLSPEGFRQSVNHDTATAALQEAGLKAAEAEAALDKLVAGRLLTAEEHGQIRRLELTHDVLAPIVRESRDRRRKENAKSRLGSESSAGHRAPSSISAASSIRAPSEDFWNVLLENIDRGRVIPVVGPHAMTLGGEGRPLYPLIAQKLAQHLGLPPDLGNTVHDVVRAFDLQGGRRREPLAVLRHILDDPQFRQPGRSLLELASIKPFRLFLSTTFDPLLRQAIDVVRFGSQPETVAAGFSPGQEVIDLPADLTETVCYHLFGRLEGYPSFALTDGDMVNYSFDLTIRLPRLENLARALSGRSLLLIGLDLGTEARLLSLCALLRLVGSSGMRDELNLDDTFAEVRKMPPDFVAIVGGNPLAEWIPEPAPQFVAELFRRWHERHPEESFRPDTNPTSPPPIPPLSRESNAVFISYAREDYSAAQRIVQLLEQNGIAVWLDRQQLRSGDSFDIEISRAIEQCPLFFSLISHHTESRYEASFRRERHLALKRVERQAPNLMFYVPILIDGLTPSDVKSEPYEARSFQMIPAPNGELPASFVDKVKETIRQRVRDGAY